MRRLLKISSVLAILVGVIVVIAGIWAAVFTYQNIAREKIVTPSDASIPNAAVRDPLTLMSQAEIIRHHTLTTTNDQTYAEMPTQVAKVDASGSAVLDKDGKPVMIANAARNIWVTATTLTTALNLGIMAYALSGFAVLFGLVLIWAGLVASALSRRY